MHLQTALGIAVSTALLACGSSVTVLGGSGAGGTSSSSQQTSASVSPITSDVSNSVSTTTITTDATNATVGPTTTVGPSTTVTTTTTNSGTGGAPGGGVAYLQAGNYGQQKMAYAAFMPQGSPCKTLVAASSCSAYSCPNKPTPGFDAGSVVVASQSGKVQLQFDGNQYDGDIPFLKVGEPITFYVLGSASVPAFDATITLTPPTTLYFPKGATLFKTSEPLTVAWMGAQGTQTFGIQSEMNAPVVTVVNCAWPAALQKTQIPQNVMAALPKGNAIYYAFSGDSLAKMAPNNWTVNVAAFSQDPEQGSVTIQ
jgi:hypothetical protein